MPLPEGNSKIPIDAIDGDWIKRGRWDLHGIDSRDALLAWLVQGGGISVEQFKRLDVYQANVERLPWLRSIGGPP